MAKKGKEPERLYKVFVSSTFVDNEERRKIVQDAITMAGMVWYGMENFTAGVEPVKDACLSVVSDADLFVGIIARRYGWEPYGKKSITEMEYDTAKECSIDRLMFRLDKPSVDMVKDIDTGPDKWKKQEKLDLFIKKFTNDQIPALFKESTLSGKIYQALDKWKKDQNPGHIIEPVVPTEMVKSVSPLNASIENYRKKAESLHGELPVAGFITQLKVPIDIEDIFVPLRAMIDLRGVHENGRFADATHAEKMLRECDSSLEISLLEAFQQTKKRRQQGIVILGDPGSGKTTHLKRLL